MLAMALATLPPNYLKKKLNCGLPFFQEALINAESHLAVCFTSLLPPSSPFIPDRGRGGGEVFNTIEKALTILVVRA